MSRKRITQNQNNKAYALACTAINGTITYFKKLATNPVVNSSSFASAKQINQNVKRNIQQTVQQQY